MAVATFELEGCPVQLLVFPPAWEELIFSHVNAFKLDRQTIMVVDWKVLVLLKLYAGAPLDLADAQVLLQINGERPSENNKNSLAFLRAHAKRLRVSRKLATLLNATNANSIKGDS